MLEMTRNQYFYCLKFGYRDSNVKPFYGAAKPARLPARDVTILTPSSRHHGRKDRKEKRWAVLCRWWTQSFKLREFGKHWRWFMHHFRSECSVPFLKKLWFCASEEVKRSKGLLRNLLTVVICIGNRKGASKIKDCATRAISATSENTSDMNP